MMPNGDLPNNGNVWQTTEPVKLENKAPPTPTEVTAQVRNASSVKIAWQWTSSGPAPSCFNTTCVIYHSEGGGETSLQLRDPAATNAILTGLQCNTCYTITVVATAGEHRRESVSMIVFLPLQGTTHMCLEDPDELGSPTDPGARPSADPGAWQTPDPGARPSTDPGARPSPDPGARPSTDPRARPSPDPGARPSPDPGARPSPDPGLLAGVAVFVFVIVLVLAVACIVVLFIWWRYTRMKNQSQRTTGIPMKECSAYGVIDQGGSKLEEANVYEEIDQGGAKWEEAHIYELPQ